MKEVKAIEDKGMVILESGLFSTAPFVEEMEVELEPQALEAEKAPKRKKKNEKKVERKCKWAILL